MSIQYNLQIYETKYIIEVEGLNSKNYEFNVQAADPDRYRADSDA